MRLRLFAAALLLAAGCYTQSNPDTTQPIGSTDPVDHAGGVRPDTDITVFMVRPIEPGTVNSGTFKVTQEGTSVAGSLDASGTVITFTPDAELKANTEVVVALTTGIHYSDGNPLPKDVGFVFTTGEALDHTPPTVSGVEPAADATGVAPTAVVKVTFNETMSAATITLMPHGGGAAVAGTTTVSDRIATFTPSAALAQGITYDAVATTASQDLSHNTLQSDFVWSFTIAVIPFGVASAQATSSTKVAVAFTAVPKAAEANVSTNYCIGAGTDTSCSNTLAVTSATLSGSTVTLVTPVQPPQTAYKVFVSNVTRDPDGVSLATSTATFSGFGLIQNSSFDADTSAPPAGWTKTGTAATLTAVAGGTPAAFDGTNFAKFSTLTSNAADNEAASSCFLIDHAKNVNVSAYIYTPEAVANTSYAFKVFFYTDTGCATAVSSNPSASSSASLSAQNVWELHSFSQAPTAGTAAAQSAKVGIRARFNSPGTASSLIYYDNVIVTQP